MLNWRFSRRRSSLTSSTGDREEGFTMVELVTALGIFAIAATGLALGLSQSLDVTRNDKNRSVGAYLVAQDLESVRSLTFSQLTPGQTDTTETVDGVPYTVRREVEYVTSDSTSNSCDAAAASPSGSKKPVAFVRVKTSALWRAMGATKPPTADTLITPPVSAFDANLGNVAVRLYNAAGKPVGGQSISLTAVSGGAVKTVNTTTEGCGYFAFLTPGLYTASVSAPDHVDFNGLSPATTQVTVEKSTTKAVELDYDTTAKLTVNYTPLGGLPLPAAGIPVTAANSKLTVGYRVFPGGAGAQVTNLFPFTNGYNVWAGGCSDADPEGADAPANGVRYYPAATRDPATAVSPGGNTTVNLKLSGANITVVNGVGAPVVGTEVLAQHVADYRCNLESHTIGLTGATGTVGASIPYGKWVFRTTIGATSYFSGTVALDPSATTPAAVTITVP
jgi:prepilin-type N-terminal cleavage/methylation domain-containing protein